MADLLLEIGFEEFPPSFIRPAAEYIEKRFLDTMREERIPAGKSTLYFTNSRIAFLADGIPEVQPDLKEKVQGPPARIAIGPDGSLTKAGEAFMKKNSLSTYEIESGIKGDVLTGWKEEKGREIKDILLETLSSTLTTIPFKKSMRWGDCDLHFARPLRWITMLVGGEAVSHNFHGISFSSTSFGHRFLSPEAVSVTTQNYVEKMTECRVIVDFDERVKIIEDEVEKTIQNLDGREEIDPYLLKEVANIVEYPHAIVGTIPDEFMKLPPELITKVLKSDQRYFTIYEKNENRLLPKFVSILNNIPEKDEVVVKGNEKVVAARLADAAFYYDDDLSKKFQDFTETLRGVLFQKDLGSYFDKVSRISRIAEFIATRYFNLDEKEVERVKSTSMLIKNDLLTGVVFEFPDLQGIMGRYYANNAGLDEEIAAVMEEHYYPKAMGDELPTSVLGRVVAMADRVDTIAGGFMAGMKPTGSKDKFAIRRNAITLIALANADETSFNLEEVLGFACELVSSHNSGLKADLKEILEFMKQRYNAVLQFDTPVIQAAVEAEYLHPFDVKRRAEAINILKDEKDILDMAQLLKRSSNILKKSGNIEGDVDIALFKEEDENKLFDCVSTVENSLIKVNDNLEAAREIVKIKPVLDTFFDNVLVMDKDEKIMNNRLLLIKRVVELVKNKIGDISYLNI